jgi:hypothetical protein
VDARLRRSGWFARWAIQFFIFINIYRRLQTADPIRLDAFTIAISDDPVKTRGRENTSSYNITFIHTSTKSAIIIVEIHLIQTTHALQATTRKANYKAATSYHLKQYWW